RATWKRFTPSASGSSARRAPIRTTPIMLLPRRAAALWSRAAPSTRLDEAGISPRSRTVADYLREHGASFYDEILADTGLLRTQVEEALAELVALGFASSDS